MAEQPLDLETVVARWSAERLIEDALGSLGGEAETDWITLAEAEAIAGVSRSTLRAWYRAGRIPSRLMPGPHGVQRLVPRAATVEQAARSARSRRTVGAHQARPEVPPALPTATEDETAETQAVDGTAAAVRLAELAVSAARERAERAEARAAAAEEALRSALERAAAAEAELRLLRGER